MKYRYRIVWIDVRLDKLGRGKPKFTSFRDALTLRGKLAKRYRGQYIFSIQAMSVEET